MKPLPGAILRVIAKSTEDEHDTHPRWVRLCAMIAEDYPEFVRRGTECEAPLSRGKIEQKIAYWYANVPALIVEAWESVLKGERPEETFIRDAGGEIVAGPDEEGV